MSPLQSSPATRLGFTVLALLAAVVTLRLGETFFIPTIIALLLAAVLGPAAGWLHHTLRFPWTLACFTAVGALVLVTVALTLVPIFTIPRMLAVLPRPDDKEQTLKVYHSFRALAEQLSPVDLDEDIFPKNPQDATRTGIFRWVTTTVQDVGPKLLLDVTRYGTMWVWQWILILFVLLFLLLEGKLLTRRLVEIFGPAPEVRAKVSDALAEMARSVRVYLVWRTVINIGLAVVVGVVYEVAGLHLPWTWAILLGVLNYIPYLGPIVAGIPPLLDAMVSISPLGAVVILAVYTAVIIVEGYIIVPVLMGRSMELNATTVMLACLFWELVWGALGLFLAMPLMAAVRAICWHVPEWRRWANLMGTTETEPEPPGPLDEPLSPEG